MPEEDGQQHDEDAAQITPVEESFFAAFATPVAEAPATEEVAIPDPNIDPAEYLAKTLCVGMYHRHSDMRERAQRYVDLMGGDQGRLLSARAKLIKSFFTHDSDEDRRGVAESLDQEQYENNVHFCMVEAVQGNDADRYHVETDLRAHVLSTIFSKIDKLNWYSLVAPAAEDPEPFKEPRVPISAMFGNHSRYDDEANMRRELQARKLQIRSAQYPPVALDIGRSLVELYPCLAAPTVHTKLYGSTDIAYLAVSSLIEGWLLEGELKDGLHNLIHNECPARLTFLTASLYMLQDNAIRVGQTAMTAPGGLLGD